MKRYRVAIVIEGDTEIDSPSPAQLAKMHAQVTEGARDHGVVGDEGPWQNVTVDLTVTPIDPRTAAVRRPGGRS